MSKDELHYPDLGGRFDDRNVLRVAALFTSAQRASAAYGVLGRIETTFDQQELAFLAIEALDRFVLATEDTLGWFFALLEWRPGGGAEHTLFAKLDTLQVGRGKWTEQRALDLLGDMDEARFRAEIAHLPTDDELTAAGWDSELVQLVAVATGSQLEGFKRVAERRARGDRSLVRAYNKSKHMLLAFPAERNGKLEIDLLTATDGPRAYRDLADGLQITGAQLSTDPRVIRERVQGTITMHSVLHAIQAAILRFRFGEALPNPGWFVRAGEGEAGWAAREGEES